MKSKFQSGVSLVSLSGALLLASVALPGVAWAQSAADSTSAGSVTQQAAAPTEQEAEGGEILVTAQRRSERLKDVPLSVTVFSAEELGSTGVTGSKELQTAVPGLQIQATGGYVQPNIRGIGTVQSSAGSESNIALYVDGIYMPNQAGNVFELEDLESIQG